MELWKKCRIGILFLAMLCLITGCSPVDWKTAADTITEQASKEIKKPEEVESISTEAYAYQTLDEQTKKVYDEVLDAILKNKESVAVSTTEREVLDNAYNAVNADYGGLFWVSGYMYTQHSRGDNIIGMDFSPSYTMEQSEREEIQAQIDSCVEELLTGIPTEASDYEKVKYVFETLIEQVDYNPEAENNQNIISVFLNGETVCQGYACATQYLLRLLNIQCTIVTGKADGDAHAWNLVRMDGDYYYLDTTWGNSRYYGKDRSAEKYVNYNYLGITSEEISTSHQADTIYTLPECTATADNYYVHEGLYFDQWDPDAIGEKYAKAWENGQKKVSVKFATPELYEQAVQFFIHDEKISNYCDVITTMYYIENKEQKILSISF